MGLKAQMIGAALALFAAAASAEGYGYDYGYGHDRDDRHDARQDSVYGQQRANQRCREARDDQKLAGALVGGLLGAVAGGLIVENNTDDEYRYARYGRHYGRRGHGRYRGYRGRRVYRYKDSNDGEVFAGAALGAVVGGLAGSELAESSANCDTQWKYENVPPPTRSAHGAGWNSAPQPFRARREPVYTDAPLQGGPVGDAARGACQQVWRETRMPDGRVIREPVMACRDGASPQRPGARDGEWVVREDCGLQTRDPDCIG